MKQLILIFLIFPFSLLASAQNQRLLPADESKKDPSLNEFVNKLKAAIVNKDKQYILSILDKNIKNSFGGNDGIEEFKEMWKINSANSRLWATMDTIIKLGGVFTGSEDKRDQFVFPYVFSLELKNDDDFFSVKVVTTDRLNVKERPDDKSKTVGVLSYDVVWTEYSDDFKPGFITKGWTYIRTLDRKITGYVPTVCLYSPIGYRMTLTRTQNSWKITSLLAGD